MGSKYFAGEVLHVEPVCVLFNPPGARNPSGSGAYLFGQPRDIVKSPHVNSQSGHVDHLPSTVCTAPQNGKNTATEELDLLPGSFQFCFSKSHSIPISRHPCKDVPFFSIPEVTRKSSMATHSCNPNTWEARTGEQKFPLSYIASSGSAWATCDAVLKTKEKGLERWLSG